MVTRKRTTGQTTIYKTPHRYLKIEQHNNTNSQRWTQVLQNGQLSPLGTDTSTKSGGILAKLMGPNLH